MRFVNATLLILIVTCARSANAGVAPDSPPSAKPPLEVAKPPANTPRNTVAVLYFDFVGGDPSLSVLRKGLTQMLIADLAGQPAVDMIEREQLQSLIDELKLNKQVKMDEATAAKIGKLLGVHFLVLGGYFSLGETLRVDVRVVEVETGKIVKGSSASGSLADFLAIEQKLSISLGQILAELPAPKKSLAQSGPAKPARPRPVAPKLPAALPGQTAIAYSKALDLKDEGKVAEAKVELEKVVRLQPDFMLAKADLAKMMR